MKEQKELLWKRDRCLKNTDIDKYDVLSVDVFDTLLFRTVDKPADIFKITCRTCKQKGLTDMFTDEQVFCRYRQYAEKVSKKKTQKMKDIYACMTAFPDTYGIMAAELEAERENSYINVSVESLIKYASGKGIKVCLTSDMYLTGDQISSILTYHGFDISDINRIFVSSEVGCSKYGGKLYDYIADEYGNGGTINILHIGDNFETDYLQAIRHNISAVYYDIAKDIPLSDFSVEETVNGGRIFPQLTGLRKLVAGINPYSGELADWYRIGATVVGPFLAMACDFLSDYCIEKKLGALYPIMREGALFVDIFKIIFEKKNYDIIISPIYASRRSTFLAGLGDNCGAGKMMETLAHLRSLHSLMVLLDLDLSDERIAEIVNMTSREILSEPGTIRKVIGFFGKKDIKEKIKENVKRQQGLLSEYLASLNLVAPSALLDIGYKGTSLYSICKVLMSKNDFCSEPHKLILVSDSYSILEAGNNINNFCNFCEVSDKNYVLLENLMIGKEKSTIGYRKEGAGIYPVLEENNFPEKQNDGMMACKEGILSFVRLYVNLDKEIRSGLLECRHEADKLLTRIDEAPSLEEAQIINSIKNEDFRIVYDIPIKACQKHNWTRSYKERNSNTFVGSGNIKSEDAELKRLQRELKELREENEILKSGSQLR